MKKRKFNRQAATAQLGQQVKASYAAREDTGRFRDYFDPALMDGVSKWKVGKGEHLIDIIPYMTGDQDPKVREGQCAYYLDIWMHGNVGPGEDQYVCPAQFHKPCPICDERKRRSDAGEDYKSRIKPLSQKRRSVYNVVVLDNGPEQAKGVQLLEIAHFFMEQKLVQIAKDPRTGEMLNYGSDTAEGRSVAFTRTGTGATNTGYEGHRLMDRDYEISDAMLEAAQCLDELLHIPSYDELSTAFFGEVEDGEEGEDATETVEYSDGEDDGAFDEVVETDMEEAPVAKPKPRAKAKAKAKPTCPIGMVMGDDFDMYENCDDCKSRTDCQTMSEVPF